MIPALIPMVTGASLTFWICAPLAVLGALGLVLFRKAVYSALSMAFVMLNLAVLYGTMDAPFLVFVQIIVYTGAIMMLFLFVLMLVGIDTPDSVIETLRGQRWLAALAALGTVGLLFFGIGGSVRSGPFAGLTEANAIGNVEGIASLVFGRYVFIFELTSALLITAALAAMVLAHRTRVTEKIGQRLQAAQRMRDYAETGAHPGPLPASGVFAGHNSIAVPALLPDGSVAESSVSRTLVLRGAALDPEDLRSMTADRFAAIEGVKEEEGDE
ncbi:NADH-quinone oxidoreductase subunit J [Propioniciclava tarda]|nr:NADH-quinone oxidoreductase subunit J [Propioniciclava tarda]SMO72481.1 NADH dehydrogenase subunit J [Propioniciclava tarda]HOA88100.1 NADH-quinone oxidoreductase subunit J [Propioniciclava tarda]HQA30991.1 NADH-quinone oxidoreductase subunit J [Propioniciclava tarda]HQD59967.1 NADH-quinone oxidoreductase subunit J [Propioniciclava tarda]